ncbi:MAG: type II secretion system protein GspJ [Tepidisphaeraceae bacterium]
MERSLAQPPPPQPSPGVPWEGERGTPRGFTLLELIVAMGMVAIVATALGSALKASFDLANTAQLTIEPARTAALAMTMVEQDLQNAVVPNANWTDIGVAPFSGTFEAEQSTDSRGRESDEVQFYANSDSPVHIDANGEIKQVTLQVVQDTATGEYDLVRRVVRNLMAQDQPQPDEEIICRNVASFTLQYFDGTNWNTSWDSTAEDNTLPAAVQVTLQLERPMSAKNSTIKTLTYTRTIMLPLSTAALDPNVNGGSGL